MPDILWPIKWLIELILSTFHAVFTFFGLDSNWGVTWVLSIVCLVLVVRIALIPIFVKQIKSQRNMMLVQPELAKLQKKYKGKTDRESREKFAKEQMDLYKRTGSNPLSSCLPILLQMPIFFSLFSVLQTASQGGKGVAFMDVDLAKSFEASTFVGAPLKDSLSTADGNISVWVLGIAMIILMTVSQFITQKQIMAKNQNPDVQNSQFMQTQKILLYVLPFVFLISGLTFPLGVMTYWLVSNFWTMGQQFVVIRNMPTPGSPAFKERQERLIKKGKISLEPEVAQETEAEIRQRQQPVSKSRAKKKKK